MLETTIDVFKAAMKSDPTVSASDRSRVLDFVRNGLGTPKPEPPTPAAPRILRRKTAAERLGRSLRAVDMLAQQGILKKIKLPGRQRAAGFLEDHVNKLLA
jgi:hypothetical protein